MDMRWLTQSGRALLASGAIALLTYTASAADNPAPTTKPDPPGTALIMGALREWFANADLDKDGFLDKEELAKVFRGPKAKPYDYKPDPADAKDADKPKDGDTKDGDKPKDSGSSTDKKPDYTKYPDYSFLVQLDKDADDRISREEYEDWARDYAVAIKQQMDAQQRVLQTQAKLTTPGLSKKETKQLEAELKKETTALNKYETQVKNSEKSFLQQVTKLAKLEKSKLAGK
jgi:hypothetical protein